jgi:DNA-binding beta-propeller fold protein YncE
MKYLRYFSLTALLFCLLAPAGVAQAKDLIFTLGYGVLEVIDGETDTVTGNIPLKGWTRAYTVLPGGKRMVVSASRRYLHVVDTENLKLVKTLNLNDNKEGWERFDFGITSAGDGKTIYAHLQGRRVVDGEVEIAAPMLAQIDLDSGEILRSIEVPRGVFQLLLVNGGKEVYAIGQDLYKIDVSGQQMKIAGIHSMYDKGMNIFPLWHYTYENDGYFNSPYYTMEGCGMLEINTHNGEIKESMVKGDVPMVYSFMYSPDRSKIYGGMDELYKLDAESKTITDQTIINEGTNFSLMVSSDGKKVYTGGGGSTISVFDAETLKLLKVIQMETDSMTMVRLTI